MSDSAIALLPSFEIIKKTELPNGVVVLTTKRTDPYRIRPFASFALLPTSRYAQRLSDFTCAASALHAARCARARSGRQRGGVMTEARKR